MGKDTENSVDRKIIRYKRNKDEWDRQNIEEQRIEKEKRAEGPFLCCWLRVNALVAQLLNDISVLKNDKNVEKVFFAEDFFLILLMFASYLF